MSDKENVRLHFLRPEWVFLVLFLIMATSAAFLAPMGAGPDEPAHIARAEQISNGSIVAPEIAASDVNQKLSGIENTSDKIYGGFADYGLVHTAVTNSYSYQALKDKYSFPTWKSPKLDAHEQVGKRTVGFAFSNSVVNSPLVYLPQILIYRIILLFTHNAWWLIFAFRMGGVLALALTIFLCIRAIPIGKWFMTIFGILPCTILDNITLTADTMTTICCLSFITAFFVVWMGKSKNSRSAYLVLTVSSLCMGLVKLTYLPLIFLLFLLPLLRPDLRSRRAWMFISCLVLASLLIFFIWYMKIKDVNTGVLYNAEIKPQLQKKFVLEHPGFYIKNLVALFLSMDFFQFSNFGILSMRDNYISCGWIYLLLMILSLFVSDPREYNVTAKDKGQWYVTIAFVVEYMVISILIATALYLQYTPYRSAYIAGVQSRYFMPILPLIMLSILLMGSWTLSPRIDPEPSKESRILTLSRNKVMTRILTVGMILYLFVMLLNLAKSLLENNIFLH